MKFDPNFILKGPDRNPLHGVIENIHAGKILGNALFYATERAYPCAKDNKLKLNKWGDKIFNQEPIELDEQDVKLLKQFIKECDFPGVTEVQLKELLDNGISNT